jgi:hypothetical protein
LCAIVPYYCYIVTWEGFDSLVALASGPRRQKDFCPPLAPSDRSVLPTRITCPCSPGLSCHMRVRPTASFLFSSAWGPQKFNWFRVGSVAGARPCSRRVLVWRPHMRSNSFSFSPFLFLYTKLIRDASGDFEKVSVGAQNQSGNRSLRATGPCYPRAKHVRAPQRCIAICGYGRQLPLFFQVHGVHRSLIGSELVRLLVHDPAAGGSLCGVRACGPILFFSPFSFLIYQADIIKYN